MNVEFITRRPLWQNIAIGFGISVFLLLVFLFLLNRITNHGDYLVVPEVKGKNYVDIQDELESQGFEVVIQDSIYVDSIAPNAIIKQFPEPEATVKVNRVIYLTVNCTVPPTISMPNLIGMSFRNALLELRSLGLKMGDTTFIPDMAKNAVKDQLVEGVQVKPGSAIRMGTKIDLLIGSGLSGGAVPVPDLFGLTYPQAIQVMELKGITPGVIILDEGLVDTTLGFVYWQTPNPFNEQLNVNMIRSGELMDIRISAIKPEKKTDTIQVKK